ncbi:hypothetical protein [Deinococcus aquatilis]|uniref:hypothetical protein n=1 Tax=Deinococcus aquatilis TaxID=519440 RepID=UPI0012F9627D|nr:hypothetical protein [Deinococcus aquatilis]
MIKNLIALSIFMVFTFSVAATKENQKITSIAVGQTWQVAGQSPSGWIAKSFSIKSLETTRDLFGNTLYSPNQNALLKKSRESLISGIIKFDAPSKLLEFYWISEDGLESYVCETKINPQVPDQRKGELRLWGNIIGNCTVIQDTKAISAPSVLPPNPINDPAPLKLGQTWSIRSESVKYSDANVQIKIERIVNPTPGNFTNADSQAYLSALTGEGPPFLLLGKGNRNFTVTWTAKGGLYICEVLDFDFMSKKWKGSLIGRTKTGDIDTTCLIEMK